MRTEANEPTRAWVVLAAMSVIYLFNSGFAYHGAGVLNAFMARELDISRAMLGAGFTVMLLVQGMSGPLIAGTMARFGLRSTVTAGSLVVTLAALAMAAWVQAPWQYLIAFGVLMGLGIGFSTYIPSQTLVAQWFDRHRTLAFSLVIACGGVGGFLIAPAFGLILGDGEGSWRMGWWLAAACGTVMSLVAWLLIRSRASAAQPASTPIAAATAPATAVPAGLLRMPLFWVMVLGDIAVGMPVICVLAHALNHLGDAGIGAAQAAAAIGLMSLAGLAGKMLAGVLGERIAPQRLWSLSCLTVMVGLLLLLDVDAAWRLYAFAVVLGLGYGAGLVCKSSLIGQRFGAAAFGRVIGAMAPVGICLTALSPYWVGLSWSWRSSYAPAFFLLALVALLAALALLSVRTQPPVR